MSFPGDGPDAGLLEARAVDLQDAEDDLTAALDDLDQAAERRDRALARQARAKTLYMSELERWLVAPLTDKTGETK